MALTAPSGLTATTRNGEVGETSIALAWTNNDNYDQIYINVTDGVVTEEGPQAGVLESYNVINMTSATLYTFKIRGWADAFGYSAYTSTATAYTRPDQPGITSLEANGATQLDVVWANNDTYSATYVGYSTTSGGGAGYTFSPAQSGSATTYSITGLTAGTLYYVIVLGVANSLNSVYSSQWSQTTDAGSTDTLTDTVTFSDTVTSIATKGTLVTDTVTFSDSVTDVRGLVQAISDTITFSDYVVDSKNIATDYGIYLGTSDGYLFQLSDSVYGDSGETIQASFQSKQTDFADQNPLMEDRLKTVYLIRVHYVDKYASVPLTIGVSNDNGVTYDTTTHSVGTASGVTKTKDFHFNKQGHMFTFKISVSSATVGFQVVSLTIYYHDSGDYFEI